MYCGLKVFSRNPLTVKRLRLVTGAVEHTSMDTGEVQSVSLEYDVFKIQIKYGEIPSVQCNGSLHRYYSSGHNDTLFTFRQVRKAVEKMAWAFCINLREPCLQQLEFGVNIPTKSPEAFIDSAVLCYGRGPTKDYRRKKEYYKYWEFCDYTIKLYRKGPTLVRFEVSVKRLRWLDDVVRIRTLEDLRHRDVFVRLLHHLLSCADLFLFVPSRNGTMPFDIREEWASLRDLSFWRNLQPWAKSRKQKWVRERVDQYGLVDWASYLKKCIRKLGSQMLEINEVALCAMFSTLGLLAETVAGPLGNCDRQAESILGVSAVKSSSSICCYLAARDVRIMQMLNVVIMYIDIHLGGRGPPNKYITFAFNNK